MYMNNLIKLMMVDHMSYKYIKSVYICVPKYHILQLHILLHSTVSNSHINVRVESHKQKLHKVTG